MIELDRMSLAVGGGEGLNYRGLWDNTETYSTDDYVFVPNGHTPNGLTTWLLESYKYAGLWRAIDAVDSTIFPGTDDTKWEIVCEGPRSGDVYVDADEDDENDKSVITSQGIAVDNDGTFGDVGSGFITDRTLTEWALWATEGTGKMKVRSDDIEDGGTLEVRKLYVAEDGVLKQCFAILTQPQQVDLDNT